MKDQRFLRVACVFLIAGAAISCWVGEVEVKSARTREDGGRTLETRQLSPETRRSPLETRQAPLARAVIGGLTASTVITLVLIPVIYSLFHKKGNKLL